jgi:hypothetical protein
LQWHANARDGATYVWWVDLQAADEMVDCVGPLLSREERSRADRIANNEAHREFVMTRSVLRLLLARYVGCAPEGLPLVIGPYGKLAVDAVGIGVEFNVTHSHGLALIGLSRHRHVGVDLEYPENAGSRQYGQIDPDGRRASGGLGRSGTVGGVFSLLGAKRSAGEGSGSWIDRFPVRR